MAAVYCVNRRGGLDLYARCETRNLGTLERREKGKQLRYQGVVKRDWLPTGRIDFATQLNGNEDTQPSELKLLVEERRIVESIAGNENLEIQWRLATLKETKAVVTQYHKYLSEHSLIKSAFDETALLSPPNTGVGRILWTHAAPSERRWCWTITAREPQSGADRGYSASREQAMAGV